MFIRILLIAVISYLLGTVNLPALICVRLPGSDRKAAAGAVTYIHVYRSAGWTGVAVSLAADAVRAFLIVLIGALLLKGPGFPTAGRCCAVCFGVLGRCVPLGDWLRGRQGLVFPALLLVFYDWRLFLFSLVFFIVCYLVTRRISMSALAAAVAYPLFQLILGGFFMQFILALLTAAFLVWPYRRGIQQGFTELKRRKKPAPPEESEE
jgi:glycerol-3-phosphate acyltransferase PlsY